MQKKKYSLNCQSCSGSFHETTETFDQFIKPNGGMLKMKAEYVAHGWSTFPEFDSTDAADLCCPSCGSQYINNDGFLRMDRMQEIGAFEVEEEVDPAAGAGEITVKPSAKSEVKPDAKGKKDKEVLPETKEQGEPKAKPDKKTKTDPDKVGCPHCGEMFHRNGLASHIRIKHPKP